MKILDNYVSQYLKPYNLVGSLSDCKNFSYYLSLIEIQKKFNSFLVYIHLID
jgi:hypothetical protein